jgi:hypothetical protein
MRDGISDQDSMLKLARGGLLSIGLLLGSLAWSTPARADEDRAAKDEAPVDENHAKARQVFRRGATYVRDNRWQEARDAFARSLALYPHSITWYNLAYCERSLGRPVRAWHGFQRALQTDGTPPPPLPKRERERALQFSDELQDEISYVVLELPGPGEVEVDGRPIRRHDDGLWLAGLDGAKPETIEESRVRVMVSRGAHSIRFRDDQREVERELVVDGAASVTLKMIPVAKPDRDAPPPPPPELIDTTPPIEAGASPKPLPLGFAIGFGTASLGSLIAGTVFGVRAINTWSDARDACPGYDVATFCPDERGSELSREARNAAQASTLALSLGAALGVGAVVLGIFSGNDNATLEAGPGSARLTIRFP